MFLNQFHSELEQLKRVQQEDSECIQLLSQHLHDLLPCSPSSRQVQSVKTLNQIKTIVSEDMCSEDICSHLQVIHNAFGFSGLFSQQVQVLYAYCLEMMHYICL